MRFKLTENETIKTNILLRLEENYIKYGKRYCPFVEPEKYNCDETEDFVCICKDFRENKLPGETCNCGLYIKCGE